MSDKTITDRLAVIRRIPDAADVTPQGVDRSLVSAALGQGHRGQLSRRDVGLVQEFRV